MDGGARRTSHNALARDKSGRWHDECQAFDTRSCTAVQVRVLVLVVVLHGRELRRMYLTRALVSLVLFMMGVSVRERFARYGEGREHEDRPDEQARDKGAGHERRLAKMANLRKPPVRWVFGPLAIIQYGGASPVP